MKKLPKIFVIINVNKGQSLPLRRCPDPKDHLILAKNWSAWLGIKNGEVKGRKGTSRDQNFPNL